MSSSTEPEKVNALDPGSSLSDSSILSDDGSTAVDPAPNAVIGPDAVSPDAVSPDAVSPDAVSPVSPTERMTAALLTLNLNLSAREAVETGLRAWNSTPNVCQSMVNAIKSHAVSNYKPDSIKLHFNPAIGLLSDFVQHCKLLISVNGLQPDANEAMIAAVEKTFEDFIRGVQDEAFHLSVDKAACIGKFGTQLSLVLRIGDVFNVPVFTAYVVRDVFNNAVLDSSEPVGDAFVYNAKPIANYSRLDVLLELLLHAASPDPYDTVNVLIARGINALIVSQFAQQSPTPNAVIQTECGKFIAFLLPSANETVSKMIIKSVLIAIIQNPDIKTDADGGGGGGSGGGKQFSDMFPSGQYVKYLGEVAHRATTKPEDQGPILMMRGEPVPLTRTDIIVAALTAINAAMGADAHIVAAGGAAVSYYINDFVNDMNADAFHGDVIAGSGLDVNS